MSDFSRTMENSGKINGIQQDIPGCGRILTN
jgi:hypothetical protein